MGATFEQQYKHILEEFTEFLKEETERIIRPQLFDELLDEFIEKKMERWR